MTFAHWIDEAIFDQVAASWGGNSPFWLAQLVWWLVLSVILFTVALSAGGIFTFVFRRLFAFTTQRLGPNRVGPFGMLQFLADALKLITKEDIIPTRADKALFRLAPYLAVAPFVMAFAAIPFADGLIFSNIAVGVVFIVAIGALSPLGEITAGWASNNKYAIYGGVRAAALDFSYEIPMVMAVAGVVLLAGSMSTTDIVTSQEAVWYIIPQLLGAFIFFSAALAKAGLIPTDLPEAESELVAGYSTEYSGMRGGFFFVLQFANILFIGSMITTLFLGGWLSPFGKLKGETMDLFVSGYRNVPINDYVAAVFGHGILWFLLKTLFVCFVIFWLWLTLPRVRVDQYLNLAWKVMFPLALLNLLVAAVVRWTLLG